MSKKETLILVFLAIIFSQNIIQPAYATNNFYSEFKAIRSYSTGETPVSLSVHALTNSDYYVIAIANLKSQTISLYTSNKKDPLEFYKEIPVKGHPSSVTFGDFNHDLKLDIATSNPNESTISILLSTNSGNPNEIVYNIDVRPTEIIAEDMNGDGLKDDLIILSHKSNFIYILFVQQNEVLLKKVSTGDGPISLKVFDVNRDGLKDLVTANSRENTISVFLQTIFKNFYLSNTISTGVTPVDFILNDFNADGITDMIVTNFGNDNFNGNVFFYKGFINGSFLLIQVLTEGLYHPSRVISGDFNGDNILDLAIANLGLTNDSRNGNWLTIYNGNHDGLFSHAFQLTSGINPFAVIAVDITVDNILDLLALNVTSNNLIVYQGNGDGTFGPSNNYPAGDGAHWIASGDFNLDGNPDLVTANVDSTDISVLLGRGDGSFNLPEKYNIGTTVHAVTPGDINGDGIIDLVTANIGSNTISILYGNGNGVFSISKEYIVGPAPNLVRITDLNNDGITDLVTPILESNYTTILMGGANSNDESFINNTTLFSGNGPSDAAIDDLNGDGIKDIIISHFYEDYITIFIGNGDGTFIKKEDKYVGGDQHSVIIKDINSDNVNDIVGSLFYSDAIFTVFVSSDGSFGNVNIINTGKLPSTIAINDFNSDGLDDIAVVCEFDNIITLLSGDGTGNFSYGSDFIAGSRPAALVADDINNDGKIDIAVSNWYTDDLTILLRK
jgi:hypothetical protein